MAKAFSQWRKVATMDHPEGWVFVVAVRGARRSMARQERPHRKLADRERRDDPSPDEAFAMVDSDLGLLLDRLTPRERMAVVLRSVVDLDLARIAEAMGCQVGTVKATLHSARSKLEPAVSPRRST